MARIHPNWVPNAEFVSTISLENGGSKPRVCDFDDHVRRVVKWHPSIHGHTATYSELIASRLGRLIDAPLIRATIVYVEEQLLPPDIKSRVSQPFHVGFTYVEGSNFKVKDYPGLANRGALPSAAVHLAWLQVGDQEDHNQFLRRLERSGPDGEPTGSEQFMLIDQSAVYGTDDWSNSGFGDPAREYKLPGHLSKQITWEDVEPVIQRVVDLEESDVRSCLEYYPDEWGIDPRAITGLADLLISRRVHLRGILLENLKYRLGN